VTLGSSKEVIFEGGPLPWILDASRYSQSGVLCCPSYCHYLSSHASKCYMSLLIIWSLFSAVSQLCAVWH